MAENNNRINPAECFDYVTLPRGGRRKVLNDTGVTVVINMAAVMCSESEIADLLDVDIDTLKNKWNGETFSAAYKKGRERGKWSLRRSQFELAKRNPSMAIFLGKNYLGQSDEPDRDKTDYEDLRPLADLLKEDKD